MIEPRQPEKTAYAEGHTLHTMRELQRALEAERDDGHYRSLAQYQGAEPGLPAELTLQGPEVERRDFLKIMGAGLSLAGLAKK